MKTYSLLVCIFIFIATGDVYSQSSSDIWQVIEYEELKKFSLNGKISLYNIINLEENWNQLRDKLGKPTKEITRERPDDLGLRPTWIFHYPDIKIDYSDDYTDGSDSIEFSSLSISGTKAFLTYKGHEIRISQNIEILEKLFPEAYSKRHDIPLDDSGEYYIQLNVGKSNVGISFRYHPNDKIIKEIEFYKINT